MNYITNRNISKLIPTKEFQISNDKINQIQKHIDYNELMMKADNADVNINHLENIFSNDLYYLAMKHVPTIEKKVLYLSYVENLPLNELCKIFKINKTQIINLQNNGIQHFKHNLKKIKKKEN